MFADHFKWLTIGIVSAIFAALGLFSIPSYGQGEGNNAPPPTPSTIPVDANPPAIEQTLVPEGEFAIRIAEALKLGPVTDAALAEELLSGLGIEPENGWITEYPVTPAVLGEVDNAISRASEQGVIALTKAEALKRVGDVKVKLGLDINAKANAPPNLNNRPANLTIYSYTDKNGEKHYTDNYDSIPAEYREHAKIVSQLTPEDLDKKASRSIPTVNSPQYMATPSTETINNYYIDQGPPVVTYYSPPEPYYYLYSWVPYSFWSSGFFFPGFFVMNNFHKHVFIDQHPFFISHHAGPDNRAFTRHSGNLRKPSRHGFFTPGAQVGARRIFTLDQNRHHFTRRPADSIRGTFIRPFSSTESSRRFGNTFALPNRRAPINDRVGQPNIRFGAREFIPRNQREFIPRNQREFIPRNERSFVPNQPWVDHPRAFSERHNFNPQRSFDRGVSGRFQHGMAGGGDRGGRSFGHERSSGGGSRGGRR